MAWPPLMAAIRTELTPEPVTVTLSSRISFTSALPNLPSDAFHRVMFFVFEHVLGDSPGRGIVHGIVSDSLIGPTSVVSVVGTHPLQLACETTTTAQESLPSCGLPNSPT